MYLLEEEVRDTADEAENRGRQLPSRREGVDNSVSEATEGSEEIVSNIVPPLITVTCIDIVCVCECRQNLKNTTDRTRKIRALT